jgi:hypothetical protein
MKKTMKYLAMAVLVLTGAMIASCTKPDNQKAEDVQTGTITLTTVVGLSQSPATKALTAEGVKTFAEGETMSVIYENTSNEKGLVTSAPLTLGDLINGGRSARFTFTFDTEPKANGYAKFIYPSSMADSDLAEYDFVDINKLYSQQDGTLATLASNFDLATFTGNFTNDQQLPSPTLENQLAICAFNIKDGNSVSGDVEAFSAIIGSKIYSFERTVQQTESDEYIWLAIEPVTTASDVEIIAKTSSNTYVKFLSDKTFAKGDLYLLGLRMSKAIVLDNLTSSYYAQDGDVISGTLNSEYSIYVVNNDPSKPMTVTLKDAVINCNRWQSPSAAINCEGNVKLLLSGDNTVQSSRSYYPAIHIATSGTLTIDGDGSLTATGGMDAAGIGAGKDDGDCGNIVIAGGNIEAAGGSNAAGIGGGYDTSCGDITITGGTVIATGGHNAAGIGSGYEDINDGHITCGNILITGGNVTAIGGEKSAGIGGGIDASYGNITITGGTVIATGGHQGAGIGSGHEKSGIGIHFGDISITGGTVTANGGQESAAIGGGLNSNCGNITISSGVTSVTATRGWVPYTDTYTVCIGRALGGDSGTVTIGDVTYYENQTFVNDGEAYLRTETIVYPQQ